MPLGRTKRFAGTSGRLVAVALAVLLGANLSGCKFTDGRADGQTSNGSAADGDSSPLPSGGNTAPTISGRPAGTAKVSLPYAFQPTAKDPNGDRLRFSIANKPDWAAFDPATGKLNGTPPAGSNGNYTAVQISVSDGKATTALTPFTISVVDPVIGSAQLNWQPPTTNEDGTPLQDLAGYVIRFGRDSTTLDRSMQITNPGITSTLVENLVEGRWYFTLSSVNSAGVESRPTTPVSKTIG